MNSYDPYEPVTRFTETPVSGLSRVIVASTTTAPDVSRTVPTTAAVSNCAHAGAAASIAARATAPAASNRRMCLLLTTGYSLYDWSAASEPRIAAVPGNAPHSRPEPDDTANTGQRQLERHRRDSGLGTRASGLGTRDWGLGTAPVGSRRSAVGGRQSALRGRRSAVGGHFRPT